MRQPSSPPQSNLERFIAEGADLVAFSGGKAIGGPQASGMLCGRRDLVMSAALQHLDMDNFNDAWEPPPSLIDKRRLRGTPPHGIGRTCKAGKEEIAGLLTALRLFVSEGDAVRHSRWLKAVRRIEAGLAKAPGLVINVTGAEDEAAVPMLVLECSGTKLSASDLLMRLQHSKPAVFADPEQRDQNLVRINPMCLAPGEAELVARAILEALSP